MMFQNTGLKILKRYVPMTVTGQKNQKGQKLLKRYPQHGEKQTLVVLKHITQLPEQLEKGVLYAVPAFDVEKTNPLPIMKTMTSLWKSCGFASHAINNVTKK